METDRRIVTGIIICFFIAAFCCLLMPYDHSYVPGILFCTASVVWAWSWINNFTKEVNSFDRKLASGMWEQIGLLFSFVAIVFFFFGGITLCLRPNFSDVWGESSGKVLLHIAHRFIGYNYYDDEIGINAWAFLVSVFGTVFLGGLLITTLSNIVQQRKEDIENGLVSYKKVKGHSIIIGTGSFSPYIIRHILGDKEQEKKNRVFLMTNQRIPEVCSKLRALLSSWQMECVTLISGDMTSQEDILVKLMIPDAKDVYIMGESGEYGIDSKNIECAKYVAAARGTGKCILPVYVHLKHMYSNKYIKAKNIQSPIKDNDNIFFRPFNFHENWGRLLWGYNALRIKETGEKRYKPLNFLPITENNHVHLVVVGLNDMGAALIIQASRLCHYPHFNEKAGKPNKTIISVIEKNPAIVDEFKSMYPELSLINDIEITYEQQSSGEYHTLESYREELKKLALDDSSLLTIAICYNDPDQAISAALRLPEEVYYRKDKIDVQEKKVKNNRMLTQVLVRQEYDNGLGHLLEEDERYKNFHIFGMLNEGLDIHLQDDTLPKLAMVNYSKLTTNAFREEVLPLLLSDAQDENTAKRKSEFWENVNKEWLHAFEWVRMSNRYQVDMYDIYIDTLQEYGLLQIGADCGKNKISEASLEQYLKEGYYILFNETFSQVPEGCRPEGVPPYDNAIAIAMSNIEHRRWMAERLIAGWRAPKAGEGRLDAFMIHPSLMSYDGLADSEKYKDIVVLRNVPLLDAIRKKLANG